MAKDQKIIRALVVEDMPFIQRAIKRALQSDPDIKVVGTATHGKEALKALERLKPDVITMDVEMPEMDGITAIKHIMVRNPRPVVVVSGMAKSGKTTLEALSLGAVDFVPKPGGSSYRARTSNLNELCAIVKEVAAIDPTKIRRAKFHKRDGIHKLPLRRPDGLVVLFAQRGTMGFVIRLLAMLDGFKGSSLLVVSELDELVAKSIVDGLKGRVTFELKPVEAVVPLSAGACAIIPHKWEFALTWEKNNVPILKRRGANTGRRYIGDLIACFDDSIAFIILGNRLDQRVCSVLKDSGRRAAVFDPFERPIEAAGEVVDRVIKGEFELQRVLEKWFCKFSIERDC